MHDMDTTNSTTHELDVDSLEDGESYDYYFRCNDSYGYTMDSSYHLTFSVKTSSSGGGSGGTTIIETFDVSPGESKITELSIGGGSIAYNNDDETHTIKLSGVIGNTAEFTVTSTPIKVLLKVGETEAIDVNDNGQNDLELTLLSLIGTSAKLKFKLLAENIIKPVVNPITNRTADSNLTTPPPKTAAEQQPATEHNKILLISISIAIAVIIWVIIGQLMKSKKRKERWELIETY
jgi:large-conductance mechanosensitive channel